MKLRLTYTSAPPKFDGLGTKTIQLAVARVAKDGAPIRLVATPEQHVDHQRAIYSANQHHTMDRNGWAQALNLRMVEVWS